MNKLSIKKFLIQDVNFCPFQIHVLFESVDLFSTSFAFSSTTKELTLAWRVLDFFLKCSPTGNLWVTKPVQFEEGKF